MRHQKKPYPRDRARTLFSRLGPLIRSALLAAICQAKNVFWTIRSLHGLLQRGLYHKGTLTTETGIW